MISKEDIDNILSHKGDVLGCDGARIGRIRRLFVDEVTGEPSWITTGAWLDPWEIFIPLQRAIVTAFNVLVPYTREKVRNAPRAEPFAYLSRWKEDLLYDYYEAPRPGTPMLRPFS